METTQSAPAVSLSLTVRKQDLQAASLFASEDPTRYQMNSVFLTKNSLVATNGRILIIVKKSVVYDESPTQAGFPGGIEASLPLDAVETLLKLAPKTQAEIPLTFTQIGTQGARWIVKSLTGFEFKTVEGKFPGYQQVLPKGKDFIPACGTLDARYYLTAVKARNLIDHGKATYGEMTLTLKQEKDQTYPPWGCCVTPRM